MLTSIRDLHILNLTSANKRLSSTDNLFVKKFLTKQPSSIWDSATPNSTWMNKPRIAIYNPSNKIQNTIKLTTISDVYCITKADLKKLLKHSILVSTWNLIMQRDMTAKESSFLTWNKMIKHLHALINPS